MYIADETSTALIDASGNPIYPGESPLIIHRQIKNPKVMRWNGQNSIATIDLQLYDQYGDPLYVGGFNKQTQTQAPTANVGEFQITFSASEV